MQQNKIVKGQSIVSRSLINYIILIAMLVAAWTYSSSGRDQLRATEYHDNFQTIANALEAYALDNNGRYPESYGPILPRILSTPIAYLSKESTLDRIPFYYSGQDAYLYRSLQNYPLHSQERKLYGSWIVASRGYMHSMWPYAANLQQAPVLYDATNGLVSGGAIFRSQRISMETGI